MGALTLTEWKLGGSQSEVITGETPFESPREHKAAFGTCN